MNEEMYTVNPIIDLITVDDNTVYVKSPLSGFTIKGANIPTAINDIMQIFLKAGSIDCAVDALFGKYSENTLLSMLTYLVDKKVLVCSTEVEAYLKHDKRFLEKSYVYTFGGNTLSETTEKFEALQIGIVGTELLARSIMDNFISGDLVSGFNIGMTDSSKTLSNFHADASLTYFDMKYYQNALRDIVERSDFIIAAFNSQSQSLLMEINSHCLSLRKHWLRICVDGLSAEAGPLFLYDSGPCYSCMTIRSRKNMNPAELAYFDFKSKEKAQEATHFTSIKRGSLFPLNHIASSVAHAEIMKYYSGMKCSLVSQAISIDGCTYETDFHHIFKSYECPVCNNPGSAVL